MNFNINTVNGKANSREVKPRRRKRRIWPYDYALDGAAKNSALSPVDKVLEKLKELDCKIQQSGDGWTAQCPAHNDQNPSFSITSGDDGQALMHCHRGCDLDEILDALELEARDLFPDHLPQQRNIPGRQSKSTHSNPMRNKTTRSKRRQQWQHNAALDEWNELSKKFENSLSIEKCEQLATEIGVRPEDLKSLRIGWQEMTSHDHGHFTFPEYDGHGHVIGISKRYENGEKKSMSGGQRGLYLPHGWQQMPGPIFIVEGASDTVVLHAMGISGIGRPSAKGGIKHLCELFRDESDEREIIVMGEYDPKPDGGWPGLEGAKEVARELAEHLQREVEWVLPPEGRKGRSRLVFTATQTGRIRMNNFLDIREIFLREVLSSTQTVPLIRRNGFEHGFITSQEFIRTNYTQQWLVKGILVRDQPAIVGGPKKF